MKELTRKEYEILHDIFYELIGPEDKPDYSVINSLENKGLIMKVHEKGEEIAYEVTVFGAEIIRGFEYDDWYAELHYHRSNISQENN